jgi:hypothetical protein
MRRSVLLLTLTALLLGLLAPAASAAPYCGITWGSLPKADERYTDAEITGLRAGRHACFDRLVVDVAGPITGYRVGYVPQVVQDGSGFPVPLRGGAFLEVVVLGTDYDRTGVPGVGGFQTFRQVAHAGFFEGQTTLGLGVRARLPFRVLQLAGPGGGSRIVIDVAHRW